MTKKEIFENIKKNIMEIVPGLQPENITIEKQLKDLGANSIDRADIAIKTMEDLSLKVPLIELGKVQNIQGLVDFLYEKKTKQNK